MTREKGKDGSRKEIFVLCLEDVPRKRVGASTGVVSCLGGRQKKRQIIEVTSAIQFTEQAPTLVSETEGGEVSSPEMVQFVHHCDGYDEKL